MEKFFSCCFPNSKSDIGNFKFQDQLSNFENFFLTEDTPLPSKMHIPVNKLHEEKIYDRSKPKSACDLTSQAYKRSSDAPMRAKTMLKEDYCLGQVGTINSRLDSTQNSVLLKSGTMHSKNLLVRCNTNKTSGHLLEDANNKGVRILLNTSKTFEQINIDDYPEVELEDFEGTLLKEKYIKINALGLKGVLKSAKYGVTAFGVTHNKEPCTDIDIILNSSCKPTSEEIIFVIFFCRVKKQYFLSSKVNDLSKKMLFVRLDKVFPLRSKNIISLGDTHISLRVDKLSKLYIEVVANQGEYLISKEYEPSFKGNIKIGRSKSNEIVLNNSSLSRIQTSVSYNSVLSSWIIEDGTHSQKSMNGTWILLDFEWEIREDKLFFQINKNFLVLRKIHGIKEN